MLHLSRGSAPGPAKGRGPLEPFCFNVFLITNRLMNVLLGSNGAPSPLL